MKGYLYKWTNYLKGYQKRWFVLQNGLVSYYRNQAEMAHTCRGTIYLANATIRSTGAMTFVISTSSTQTFHIKAGSDVEQRKWLAALKAAKSRARALRKQGDDSDMYADGYEDEDDVKNNILAENGVKLINQTITNIEARVTDLQRNQDVFTKKGEDLQKAISELEIARDPAEVVQRFNVARDRATVYKIACLAILNSCTELTTFVRTQVPRWQRLVDYHKERCALLEQMVEELAKQLRHLEMSFRQTNLQNSVTLAASGRSVPTCLPGQAIRVHQTHCSDIPDTKSFDSLLSYQSPQQLKFITSASVDNKQHVNSSNASPSTGKTSTTNINRHSHAKHSGGSSSDDDFYDAEEANSEFSITLPNISVVREESNQNQLKSKLKPCGPTHDEDSFALTSSDLAYEYESDVGYTEDDDDDDDDEDYGEAMEPGTLMPKHNQFCEARVIQPRAQKHERASSVTVNSAMSNENDLGSDVVNQKQSEESVRKDESPSEAYISKRSAHAISRRESIPPKPNISLNLWGIVKNCIGKELTKIPMPVNFSEPLSMLQRLTEDFEYSACLDRAAACQDSLEQMAYVAAFTVSAYATTAVRTNKPFNPLLGETYECDRTDDLGWRSLAEQVSHHPPACALHCESNAWYCWFEFSMTTKFRGKYLQINPVGTCHLVFRRTGHHYTWRKIPMTVHNIIVGRLWIDNSGEMDIVNHNTGEKCHLSYKAYSYFSNETPRRVTGAVLDKEGSVRYVLNGTWDDSMEFAPVISTRQTRNGKPILETGPACLLWKCAPLPVDAEKMYGFTRLALQLNEPEEGISPTDSRLRPDQRLMEEGRWDEANRAKVQLEELQRQRRKKMAIALAEQTLNNDRNKGNEQNSNGVISTENNLNDSHNLTSSCINSLLDIVDSRHKPLWFTRECDPTTDSYTHVFTGKYWECKATQDWSMCPNIYA